jgi:hypothetical protein
MKKYVFHSDAGHGWVAVKRKELVELGIINKVSSCSYERGNTVYLEEDCDAALFVEAAKKKDPSFDFIYRESFQDHSPIRSYSSFKLRSNEKTA